MGYFQVEGFRRTHPRLPQSRLCPPPTGLATLNEVRDRGGILLLLTVTFTNPFDARELLDQVFWCGCEAIFFTIYNIYTNYENIFPTLAGMHSLPYDDEEEV